MAPMRLAFTQGDLVTRAISPILVVLPRKNENDVRAYRPICKRQYTTIHEYYVEIDVRSNEKDFSFVRVACAKVLISSDATTKRTRQREREGNKENTFPVFFTRRRRFSRS